MRGGERCQAGRNDGKKDLREVFKRRLLVRKHVKKEKSSSKVDWSKSLDWSNDYSTIGSGYSAMVFFMLSVPAGFS